MYRACRNLMVFYTLFFSLFISQKTLAEDVFTSGEEHKTVAKGKSINQGGFIVDLQQIDPVLLAEDVEKLRSRLIRRQYKLVKLVDDAELDAGDAIITVIMPGGLLYAGYKKHQLEQAKSVLLEVSDEIRELSNDLIALQGQDTNHPILLAQLP